MIFCRALSSGLAISWRSLSTQLEPRLVVQGMALLKVFEGVLGGAPAAEDSAGGLLQTQVGRLGVGQTTGATIAGMIPQVDVAQREISAARPRPRGCR